MSEPAIRYAVCPDCHEVNVVVAPESGDVRVSCVGCLVDFASSVDDLRTLDEIAEEFGDRAGGAPDAAKRPT